MTTVESLVTIQEALTANARALQPAIWEAAMAAALKLGYDTPGDAWELAVWAQSDGELYARATRPAILFCGRSAPTLATSRRDTWQDVARRAIDGYKRAYCDKEWQPTPGTLEILTCYFEHVYYAELIAETKANGGVIP